MEMYDIFDANYNHIGVEESTKSHIEGTWHQTIHCWIIRPNGKMLIQHRGKDIKLYPDQLDVSVAGHLSAGETEKDAPREVKEELGIDISYEDMTHLGYYKDAVDTIRNAEPPIKYKLRHITHVHFARDDRPMDQYKLQPEEVDGIYEIDIKKAIPFFYGDNETIVIEGYKRTDKGLEPHTRTVTFNDFTSARGKWFWVKIFIMAERYMNGEKYLAI